MKFPRGYCAITWFEELDQFEGVEAVRSILNSLRRGGDRFWIFYSYNPPRTMWLWVNVESLERAKRADTLVRRSSYLDVVDTHPEWLGEPFIDEAEYLRDERLSLSRIHNFERTRNGVDWGWFSDPWRFVRCAWEPSTRRLLIFEEHSANRKTPAETAQVVLDAMTCADEDGDEPYFHDEIIWADEIPDGNDHSIDAVRYAMIDDVLWG